jgi:hypothetical protein
VDVYRGKQRDKFLAGINNGWLEALLVSYETLRMDFCLLNAVDWSCVIFDEVHRLKRTLLSLRARNAASLTFVPYRKPIEADDHVHGLDNQTPLRPDRHGDAKYALTTYA